MSATTPPVKSIPLSELYLDQENPRLDGSVESSRAALLGLLENNAGHIVTLAKDIAEKGLDPSQLPVVMKAGTRKYTVLEGNRRTAALKLLHNPEAGLGATGYGEAQKRALKKAAEASPNLVSEVRCVVVADREEAANLIEGRHTGERDGAGLVGWGPREQALFKRRMRGIDDPTLDVLEFVRAHGDLKPAELKKLRNAFTNIQRLIDDRDVRPLLGIEVVKGQVRTRYGRDEVLKGLRRVVLAAATDKLFNSRTMNETEERVAYVEAFAPEDRPDPNAATGELLRLADAPETRVLAKAGKKGMAPEAGKTTSLEGGSPAGEGETDGGDPKGRDTKASDDGPSAGRGKSGGEGAGEKKRREKGSTAGDEDAQGGEAPPSNKRKSILPAGNLHITDARVNEIYEELKRLQIKYFPNAIGVLYRVFFELSVDAYCDRNSISTSIMTNGHPKEKNLISKFRDVCDHLEAAGGKPVVKKLKSVRTVMADDGFLLGTIERMHQYVHGQTMSPGPSELRSTGVKAHPFFELVWPQPPDPPKR